MASLSQLELVLGIERKKDEALARQYQQAKDHLFANQQKLSSLEQYRLDYLKLIRQKASEGLNAKALIQHQSFVGKLDKACEQQVELINQAVLVSNQRKEQWLTQQAKTQAVAKFMDKQKQKQALIESKNEQKLFDELSSLAQYKRAIS
ncbi:flagellar export protein FliJ [Glaciecola sp. XM2]|jgi:flagellar FliJ protein|uniref:flagellar export protein FliJ n=1 Tax=Glaciecola sp. XM2 TaxID=1914931 RepID=UPI001BDF31A4|nr:flagellar export protein FliJ [Glaciecola sp. XM2]MBT1450824.1 flagellar export protein FliJ [Glaciecola sp. XM2]